MLDTHCLKMILYAITSKYQIKYIMSLQVPLIILRFNTTSSRQSFA